MFGQRFGDAPRNNHAPMYSDSFADQFQNRVFIRELKPGLQSKKIIGLVIAKTEMRSFRDKKNAGQFRYSHSFTIRDTADDFVNVTCWGNEAYIENIAQMFRVGEIVEINNCMVQSKQNNEYEENYRASTPTSVQVVVNETHCTVTPFQGSDYDEFGVIAYKPIKDANECCSLGDIIANGNNLHGTYINILAVVRDVGETKDITTKSGKQMKRKEVKLFDDSCVSFPLMIWDSEVATQADGWISRESVLFICDVKVTFDEFRKKMIATCTSKTIIILNPEIDQAFDMYNYAQTVNVTDKGYAVEGDMQDVDLTTIQDVYSVCSLEEKLEAFQDKSVVFIAFTGIIYAIISDLNIDIEEGRRCIMTRCVNCKRKVDRESGTCGNGSCVRLKKLPDVNSTRRSLELRVSLCDQTQGMDGFIIAGQVVQDFLKCNVDTFESLDEKSKSELKWKFLFERFKVYFKALPPRQENQKPYLSILSIAEVDIDEFIGCAA